MDLEVKNSIHHPFMNLNGLVFWKDTQSKFLGCNQSFASFANCKTPEQMIGLTDYDLPWNDYADTYREHDTTTLSGVQYAKLELIRGANNELKSVIALKQPLYQQHKMIGLIGYAYETNNPHHYSILKLLSSESHNVGKQLTCIVSNNFFWRNQLGTICHLTVRESQCLYYCLRGYTAKLTASILLLSPKTVEFHLESIKNKAGCVNKVELFEFAYQHNFINMIPKSLLG